MARISYCGCNCQGEEVDADNEQLIRSAYLAIRATQEVIKAVAMKTLGPSSNHAFTIDGKLLGDLGELVACLEFGLIPAPTGTKGVDAYTSTGQTVQVKATAGTSGVFIPGNSEAPDFLIVVRFDKDTGEWQFLYRGEAKSVWDKSTSPVDSGRTATFNTLAQLHSELSSNKLLVPIDSSGTAQTAKNPLVTSADL
jgi:hypothetical protein